MCILILILRDIPILYTLEPFSPVRIFSITEFTQNVLHFKFQLDSRVVLFLLRTTEEVTLKCNVQQNI